MSGGHATFLVKNGRVTQILYSGDMNATFAPDAYCAPIMRTCIATCNRRSRPWLNWPRVRRCRVTASRRRYARCR